MNNDMPRMHWIKAGWKSARSSRTLWVIWTIPLICGITIPIEVTLIQGFPNLWHDSPIFATVSFLFAGVWFFPGLLVVGVRNCWRDAVNLAKPVDNIMLLSVGIGMIVITICHLSALSIFGEKKVNAVESKVAVFAFTSAGDVLVGPGFGKFMDYMDHPDKFVSDYAKAQKLHEREDLLKRKE